MAQLAKPLKKRKIRGDSGWGYAFIAVALVVFAIFTAYPVVSAFIISFQDYKPLGSTWVGFDNYISSFKDPLFWKSIKNTVVYTILTVPVALMISFAVAILILPLSKKLQTTFKAVYYLPAVASGVAMSVVWLWIFDPMESGIMNQLLGLFGISNLNWLGSSATSMFSLVLMSWLASHGTSIIIYLAALLGIDDSYYEAAELDGASFLKKLWYIVIPCLKPTTLFLLVTGVIGSFQVFQNAYLMTGGGPDNSTTMVGLLIFDNAFKYFEFGKAAAQSLVLAGIIAIISFAQFKFMGKDVEY
ncbi:binding-protein-dependent transport systems inner membrane component [Paenibacillus alvei TS-15]|jgi:multiple sugar transport system permease protein|uniref:Binding-protein-dependent transport systems inner membrane component n=2 Tax=Paenibacillus alvei TaxID=44250 RepID=A0A383RGA7_PAEAL|nr:MULTISPECIES: sugar ABC transporter permease [Paenibacillus]EPY07130.1 binding-protein-dependent transport systems inner membrane component [Paenibacillus alvei TS-15]EPY12620.1 binding-protein-dependent transport systems inner membrane component [Paenibacillus alvei A6-6i-x]MCY9532420.1 sugar ABC transporter permease [Paenibacillus alvei]SDE43423.1 carbohydrate ABC transporter membrane protein 1, CUT1 family [Paenibacillus sp. cl6col]SYX85853.1 Binding-protein-dependent transport systems i